MNPLILTIRQAGANVARRHCTARHDLPGRACTVAATTAAAACQSCSSTSNGRHHGTVQPESCDPADRPTHSTMHKADRHAPAVMPTAQGKDFLLQLRIRASATTRRLRRTFAPRQNSLLEARAPLRTYHPRAARPAPLPHAPPRPATSLARRHPHERGAATHRARQRPPCRPSTGRSLSYGTCASPRVQRTRGPFSWSAARLAVGLIVHPGRMYILADSLPTSPPFSCLSRSLLPRAAACQRAPPARHQSSGARGRGQGPHATQRRPQQHLFRAGGQGPGPPASLACTPPTAAPNAPRGKPWRRQTHET